jgi:hypothetical protein
VGATGLATNPVDYRERLCEQTDEQLDAWAGELMRDVTARRGVAKVVAEVQKTARLDDAAFRRVFARGGGAPQTVGQVGGVLIVPAISLHCLVSGMRAELGDARDRVIAYLVAGFDEIVYI